MQNIVRNTHKLVWILVCMGGWMAQYASFFIIILFGYQSKNREQHYKRKQKKWETETRGAETKGLGPLKAGNMLAYYFSGWDQAITTIGLDIIV